MGDDRLLSVGSPPQRSEAHPRGIAGLANRRGGTRVLSSRYTLELKRARTCDEALPGGVGCIRREERPAQEKRSLKSGMTAVSTT